MQENAEKDTKFGEIMDQPASSKFAETPTPAITDISLLERKQFAAAEYRQKAARKLLSRATSPTKIHPSELSNKLKANVK